MNLVVQRPNPIRRCMQRVAASPVGARLLAPIAHHLDRWTLRLSGGRHTLANLLTGLPVLTLTTTGAHSGQARSVPLVGFPDGERVVLIASNFGRSHYPAWYHNLRATPTATLTLDGETCSYVAREASGQERETYWRQAVGLYAGYAAYAQRVGKRHVPVMVLTPAV